MVRGNIFFEGKDLLVLTDWEVEEVRGSRIGVIFRDPMTLTTTQIKEKIIGFLTRVGSDKSEKKYLQIRTSRAKVKDSEWPSEGHSRRILSLSLPMQIEKS